MPITRKATEAATKKRVHGKHERWAHEMRGAGWIIMEPGARGVPNEVWFEAVARELREAGWEVTAPKEVPAAG